MFVSEGMLGLACCCKDICLTSSGEVSICSLLCWPVDSWLCMRRYLAESTDVEGDELPSMLSAAPLPDHDDMASLMS